MKKLIFGTLIALAVCLAPLAAQAQTATQQSPALLDAAGITQTSATSAATITITPGPGQYVYITQLDITNCAGASAVTAAAVTTVTTTGITGSPAWTLGSGVAAGLCQPAPTAGVFAKALKSSTPGAAVTIVLPTFATNQTVRVTVYYYLA